jgi:hypothetical protein
VFRLSRKRWLLAAALLLLLLAGGLGAWYFWPDPQLAKVKEMRQELLGDTARKLSPGDRRQKWEEFRKEEEKLTPAQRQGLREDARKQRKKEVEHYFTLSRPDKIKWLDQQIDRMEARRREWQAGGGLNGPGWGGGPAGGRGIGPGSPARGGPGGTQGGAAFANGTGPAGGGPGGGPGGGGWANLSTEERENRRKSMLDWTTPEERAQFDQLRKDMAARRVQRGLPPSPFGPR